MIIFHIFSVSSVLSFSLLCESLRSLRLCVILSFLPVLPSSFLFPPKYAKLIFVNTIHSIPKFPEADEPCT
jgi:hypothetical protein